MKKLTQKILSLVFSIWISCSAFAVPVHAADDRVTRLLNSMTLRQKITQMLEIDFRKWSTDGSDATDFTVMNDQVQKIIEDYDFGAVIYFANNIQETEQSYELTMAIQRAATKDNGIPLIISTDQEGGMVYRLGSGTALPGNMALGATHNPEYAEKAGEIIGSELSAVGINTALAPVVDINNNANNPVIGLRSYGDNPTDVGEMASAEIKGMAKYNVIGCAKHFPGHGDTATDSHYGLPIVNKSKSELLENEFVPYKTAIAQGIEMIMTAHILYPQLDSSTVYSEKTGQQESVPATMSKAILTDLLKNEMHFEGIVSTDAMNMAGIADTFDEVQAVKESIKAGADLICMPCNLQSTADLKNLDAIIDGVEKAVQNGEIPESRLNDGVTRILTVKENRGILDWKESDYSLEKAESTVGSSDHRNLERVMAAKAVTVVKNTNNVLPLTVSEQTKVLMLTPYENEMSQMIMGWNRAKQAKLIPDGAECRILHYIAETSPSAIQQDLDWADIYIINSEIDTAAYFGSGWQNTVPESLVRYGHDNGKQTVVISVDKPYDVQLYDNADAIMAVYGCTGSSVDVTEALVGDVTTSKLAYGPNIIAGIEVAFGVFGASGKLPTAIPQYDFDSQSYTDRIVYERGYGMTYDSKLDKEIDKQSHTVQFVADGKVIDTQTVEYGKDATAPEVPPKEGYSAKWDKDATHVTEDTTVTAVYTPVGESDSSAYQMVGKSLTVNKGKTAEFISNADFSRFVGVKVDGETVDKMNYTASGGSTKILLKADYTQTLPEGEHTIAIVSDDGQASAAFTVKSSDESSDNAKTDNPITLYLWSGVIVVGLVMVVLICFIVMKKKK